MWTTLGDSSEGEIASPSSSYGHSDRYSIENEEEFFMNNQLEGEESYYGDEYAEEEEDEEGAYSRWGEIRVEMSRKKRVFWSSPFLCFFLTPFVLFISGYIYQVLPLKNATTKKSTSPKIGHTIWQIGRIFKKKIETC